MEESQDKPIDARSTTDPAAPVNLNAFLASDKLLEGLSVRHFESSGEPQGSEPVKGEDPAILLLQSLVTDVDQGAPPLPPSSRRLRRGRPRTIVTLGVATAVLATTGAAAAGGGPDNASTRPSTVAERPTDPYVGARAELTSVPRAALKGRAETVRDSRNRPPERTQRGRTALPRSKGTTANRKLKKLNPRRGRWSAFRFRGDDSRWRTTMFRGDDSRWRTTRFRGDDSRWRTTRVCGVTKKHVRKLRDGYRRWRAC